MDYLIPTLLQQYSFQPSDVVFDTEALQEIIDTYTDGENGVRNLKRCLDTILSKVNTARFLGEPSTIVNYEMRDFGLPYHITKSRVGKLIENTAIQGPTSSNQVWKMMYL
jgi:ATP-dependent Lon protease